MGLHFAWFLHAPRVPLALRQRPHTAIPRSLPPPPPGTRVRPCAAQWHSIFLRVSVRPMRRARGLGLARGAPLCVVGRNSIPWALCDFVAMLGQLTVIPLHYGMLDTDQVCAIVYSGEHCEGLVDANPRDFVHMRSL